MKRGKALLLAAALALSMCACGGEEAPADSLPADPPSPTPARTVPLRLGYDPDAGLDPIVGDSQVNQTLSTLVFEGLYELDEQFRPQPVLARGAQTDESGLVWTIEVDDGACFSDGTPLSADHVAASLNAARSSALYGGRLSQVVSVWASDGAVILTLAAPNGGLPALLDIPVALSGEDGLPLGTGRYRYVREGDGLCLAVNPYHRGELPYETIALCPTEGTETRIAAFHSGAVNVVTTDFFSAYALGYSCAFESWDYASPELLYVGFRSAGGPCVSAGVRRALSRAFDRVAVVKDLLAGHGDEAALPVSPLHEEYDAEQAGTLAYDLSAAEQLLAQAGYVRGEDGLWYSGRTALSLTLLVNSDNAQKTAVAEFLASSLDAFGVTVTVSKLPWRDYLAALAAGEFDLYLGEVRLTGDFDVTELLTGGLNYGGYGSPELTEAVAARRAAAGQARLRAAKELWTAFVREAPIAPLCFTRSCVLVRGGAAGNLSPTWGDPFHGLEGWQPATE